MTFSIIARCEKTGQFGAAISSSSPAVASRCIRARAGIGIAASQNVTDPALGNVLLDLIKYGLTPEQAIFELKKSTEFINYRQLMVIDGKNPPAIYSGDHALGTVGSARGTHAISAGNMLATDKVPQTMIDAFEKTTGSLAERLMQALIAGQRAGGEAGPVHSAGILVVDKVDWPVVDLRVDWIDEDPIGELYKTWKVYEPQVESYVQRALTPQLSPSYGVPGDM